MKKYVEKIHLIPTAGVSDQALTVSNAVAQLAALNSLTTHVLLSVATANVRFTIDGSDPSGTNGHVWPTTWEPQIMHRRLAEALKFFRATGSDGQLHASELTN